jgi:hypothetical protein
MMLCDENHSRNKILTRILFPLPYIIGPLIVAASKGEMEAK